MCAREKVRGKRVKGKEEREKRCIENDRRKGEREGEGKKVGVGERNRGRERDRVIGERE